MKTVKEYQGRHVLGEGFSEMCRSFLFWEREFVNETGKRAKGGKR